jgi:hypothetical protein
MLDHQMARPNNISPFLFTVTSPDYAYTHLTFESQNLIEMSSLLRPVD